jgi:hypothetical protein
MSAVSIFLSAARTCRVRARKSMAEAMNHGNVGRALSTSVSERILEETYLAAAEQAAR